MNEGFNELNVGDLEFVSNSLYASTSAGVYVFNESEHDLSSQLAYHPPKFNLLNNYPNPFNASTIIKFHVPSASGVSLIIYDLLGNEITKLVDEIFIKGKYKVVWDGKNNSNEIMNSSIYLCQIKVGRENQSIKIILLK